MDDINEFIFSLEVKFKFIDILEVMLLFHEAQNIIIMQMI